MVRTEHIPQSVDDLQRDNQRLRTRIDELDSFAHIIAHDLKNPIATIRGFASLIHDYPERLSAEDLKKTALYIVEESERLSDMIDAILLFSQVNSLEEVALEPLDMALILSQVGGRLLKLAHQFDAHISFPETWPLAMGYAPWVEHVWMNYISNAIKYGGRPPIIQLGADTRDEHCIVFWVRDNGDGLRPEDQQTVFAPFVRLHRHLADGHGLGLSIVARIVEKLGGDVSVQSHPGAGSTFSFTLPAVHQSPPDIA